MNTSSSGLPFDKYRDSDLEANDDTQQRQRLLRETDVLERGSQRLADSTRLAMETEDIGANILQDLQRQREQIEHSRDTVCAKFVAPISNFCFSYMEQIHTLIGRHGRCKK